jgi:hypothetical protein
LPVYSSTVPAELHVPDSGRLTGCKCRTRDNILTKWWQILMACEFTTFCNLLRGRDISLNFLF